MKSDGDSTCSNSAGNLVSDTNLKQVVQETFVTTCRTSTLYLRHLYYENGVCALQELW